MSSGRFVVGFGCERDIAAQAVLTGLRRFLVEQGVGVDEVARIATIDLKSDETGLVRAARRLGCPVTFFSRDQLRAVADVPNPNPVVKQCIGVAGVAEPAALLASGAASLHVEKTVVRPLEKGMTLALARSGHPQPAVEGPDS